MTIALTAAALAAAALLAWLLARTITAITYWARMQPHGGTDGYMRAGTGDDYAEYQRSRLWDESTRHIADARIEWNDRANIVLLPIVVAAAICALGTYLLLEVLP